MPGNCDGNNELHPFMKCITTTPIAIHIIKNSWSLTALHSILHFVNTNKHCDQDVLRCLITGRIARATDLATIIWVKHSMGRQGLPLETCHIGTLTSCHKAGTHSVEHYSAHLRSGSCRDLNRRLKYEWDCYKCTDDTVGRIIFCTFDLLASFFCVTLCQSVFLPDDNGEIYCCGHIL